MTGRWAKTPLTLKFWAQNENAEVPGLARIQISVREPQESEEGAHVILPELFPTEQAFSSALAAAWRSDSLERAFEASENDLFCKVNDLERQIVLGQKSIFIIWWRAGIKSSFPYQAQRWQSQIMPFQGQSWVWIGVWMHSPPPLFSLSLVPKASIHAWWWLV